MSKVNYVILSNSLVVNFEGKTFNIASSDGRYHKILEAIKAGKLDLIPDLTDTTIALKQAGVDIRSGVVYMDDKPLPDTLSDRVLQFFNEGLPFEPLLKFWVKLQKNPSFNSRQQLFKFLEHNGHPITTEGNFIAYRSVTSDFKDHHTRKMDNSVGQIVKVDRSEVDDNPNNTCSNGLHVACLSYADTFGSNRVIVDVEVNPENVVAVPTDYNGTKMRVCEFKVLAVSEGLRKETLVQSGYENEVDFEEESEEVEEESFLDDCCEEAIDKGNTYCPDCGEYVG